MVEEIDVSEYSGIHSKYSKPTDIYLTLKTMLFLLATWVCGTLTPNTKNEDLAFWYIFTK